PLAVQAPDRQRPDGRPCAPARRVGGPLRRATRTGRAAVRSDGAPPPGEGVACGRHSGPPDGRRLQLRREGPAPAGRPPGAHGRESCTAALHHAPFVRTPRSGLREIGRASCRERIESLEGTEAVYG